MKRQLRKLFVLAMCVMMVASTCIVANADTGTFSKIYVDYPDGNNYTSKIGKTSTTSYASVTLSTILTSNHAGHYLKIRKNGTTASESLAFTSTGTKTPYYLSGYATKGSGYDAYFYCVSASAAMYLTGSWTPN